MPSDTTPAIRRTAVLSMAATALLFALAILNRWPVTEQGIASFGRLWHLYISYFDFGFARRALLGTLLEETGINALLSSEYLFAYVFHGLCLVALVTLVTIFLIRHRVFDDWLAPALIYFSPAFILQSAYLTGSLDLVLLLLAAVMTLYIQRLWLVALGLTVGVLIHELFLFMTPFLLLVAWHKHRAANPGPTLQRFVLTATPALIAGFAVLWAGTLDVPRTTYQELMAARTPDSAFLAGNGSGYFELTSSVSSNLEQGWRALFRLTEHGAHVSLPLAYALLLATVLALSVRGPDIGYRIALATACLMPLAVMALAADIYRWIGMSANLSLLGLLHFGAAGQLVLRRRAIGLLLMFSLLAPFGDADIQRPFPAHQRLLELIP